ncbi:chitinase [Matsumuraeses phaseoli granulovirus]|uniref:Chitinase n=1 Tax=Matsumuraeses phaseoli granulovirus TaxID=2760664 RepID=A0AAE7SYM2_9BBAC|nr:chitinase [Matsumuraeses phaseoli granulovirus]QOD39972.1 chitinase [Matsumuraeses phaseoli granulovirus]
MKISACVVLLTLATLCDCLPGKPQLKWATHKYFLVELNEQATSYENLIINVHKSVNVTLKWDVWSGDKGNRSQLLFDDKVVKNGTDDELFTRIIRYETTKGGKYKAKVRLCNDDGCNDSNVVTVVVADTDGSHLNEIPYLWLENNVPFKKTNNKTVAAYFVEWSVYGRQFPVDKVPIPNLTHLLYGFIPICGGDGINDSLKQITGSFEALQRSCANRDDYKVSIHDIWAALQKPQKGVTAFSDPYKGNFGQLMAIKHFNPNITILPSIGGWTLSDPFYHFNDSSNRQVFVDSVRDFLSTWKFFDGVDVDWEFPGGKGANPELGNAIVDSNTYTELMRDLSTMLYELGEETGKKYQLTSAIGAGYDKIDVVDYTSAQVYLDHIFVMTYDFKGAWSNKDLGFQTALDAPAWNLNENYTVKFAIDRLLDQNVDSRKLVVGVAMYGRGWTGVRTKANDSNPFNSTASGPVKGTWESGVVDYRDLLNRYNYNNRKYDVTAQAAYVYDNNDLVTYDSQQSVRAKANYVLNNNLGGLFAWEVDADNGNLLNAMNEGLGNKQMYFKRYQSRG